MPGMLEIRRRQASWMTGVAAAVCLVPVMMAYGTSGAAGIARARPIVHPRFDLSSPASPFPSDNLTIADGDQLTGRRVNLPLPTDCVTNASDCEDIRVLNRLDGFNMQPRLSILFDGAIDLKTVGSRTMFLVSLATGGGRQVVGINQVVWDPSTNILYARSDELLEQHTRYALILTRGIHDASGAAIEPADAFGRFLTAGSGPYRRDLLDAVRAAGGAGVRASDIAVASVFTTQTFSHVI